MKFVSLNSCILNLTHAKPYTCLLLRNTTYIEQVMIVIWNCASFVNLNSEDVELRAEF